MMKLGFKGLTTSKVGYPAARCATKLGMRPPMFPQKTGKIVASSVWLC